MAGYRSADMEDVDEKLRRISSRRVNVRRMMDDARKEYEKKVASWEQRLEQLDEEEELLRTVVQPPPEPARVRGRGTVSYHRSSSSDAYSDDDQSNMRGHGADEDAPPGYGGRDAPPGVSKPLSNKGAPPGYENKIQPRSGRQERDGPPGFENARNPATMRFTDLRSVLATSGSRTSALRQSAASATANGTANGSAHEARDMIRGSDDDVSRSPLENRRVSERAARAAPPGYGPSSGATGAAPRTDVLSRLGARAPPPTRQKVERWVDEVEEEEEYEEEEEDEWEKGGQWPAEPAAQDDADSNVSDHDANDAMMDNYEWSGPAREAVPATPPNLEASKVRVVEAPQAPMEEFPSLGADSNGAAPRLAGAWGGSRPASQVLAAAAARQDAAVVAAASAEYDGKTVEEYEAQMGLRPGSETLTDRERRRQSRKKQFEFYERVRGRDINVVEGLELHQEILNAAEQRSMVSNIKEWEMMGRQGLLRGRTFSNPRKSMRGKGRVTIQFGTCYNYAVDRQGRKPGIIPEEVVEPLPPVLTALVKRLVRWGVLPKAKEPDTAIVNIYDVDDCIPPHIDHHDFDRPFVTLSLLSEQSIMFGAKLVPLAPGEFAGSTCFIPLPVGSCLVLKGNGADVAMHCVPPVTAKRISITLRCMGSAHARKVREIAARVLAAAPSPLMPAPGGVNEYEDEKVGSWAEAAEDESELEVERRRARRRKFHLGDMWPALRV